MKIRQYQIDAFASRVFEGNPAAVCPLEAWLGDDVLQAIAQENNLSETAFFVPTEKGFHLRWFTPITEVDLCGHATLASAHVIFNILGYARRSVSFGTRSGELTVGRDGEQLEMNFPAARPKLCDPPGRLIEGLGHRPKEVLAADDYVAVYDSEAVIRSLTPDFVKLHELDLRGVVVTAPGTDVDFVSRFFAPKYGIPEDPVTGSAHCELTPYWSSKLGKDTLNAKQVSKRSGYIRCQARGERIILAGRAVTFMEAEIDIGT
jgi:predicted PhzF superfamily epimerase YddE/YHI9